MNASGRPGQAFRAGALDHRQGWENDLPLPQVFQGLPGQYQPLVRL